jgi:hypothetical protein
VWFLYLHSILFYQDGSVRRVMSDVRLTIVGEGVH